MDGTTVLANSAVGPFNPGPDWQIKDTGDFNGDGKSDILWQGHDGTPVSGRWTALMSCRWVLPARSILGRTGTSSSLRACGSFSMAVYARAAPPGASASAMGVEHNSGCRKFRTDLRVGRVGHNAHRAG